MKVKFDLYINKDSGTGWQQGQEKTETTTKRKMASEAKG